MAQLTALLAAQPPAPRDPEVIKALESLLPFVLRNGPSFEQLALDRQVKQQGDKRFLFLVPGNELHPYYLWRLGVERAKQQQQQQEAERQQAQQAQQHHQQQQMTAEARGAALGEKPLAPASTAASAEVAPVNPADPFLAAFGGHGKEKEKEEEQRGTEGQERKAPLASKIAEADRARIAAMLGSKFAKAGDGSGASGERYGLLK